MIVKQILQFFKGFFSFNAYQEDDGSDDPSLFEDAVNVTASFAAYKLVTSALEGTKTTCLKCGSRYPESEGLCTFCGGKGV